jgi:hypothetical protein
MADDIEWEYEKAIRRAEATHDSDRALELSIGLAQYRTMFKPGGPSDG